MEHVWRQGTYSFEKTSRAKDFVTFYQVHQIHLWFLLHFLRQLVLLSLPVSFSHAQTPRRAHSPDQLKIFRIIKRPDWNSRFVTRNGGYLYVGQVEEKHFFSLEISSISLHRLRAPVSNVFDTNCHLLAAFYLNQLVTEMVLFHWPLNASWGGNYISAEIWSGQRT